MLIGIDPGKHGALCLMSESGDIAELLNMPESEDDLISVFRSMCPRAHTAFIEQIPKFAGENRSAAFMAVLFGNYKFCCASVLMHGGTRLIQMTPLKWMNVLIPQKDRSRDRSERKRQLCVEAKKRWPNSRITLQNCDVPLIAFAGSLLSS